MLLVASDYDGTLAPIVSDPAQALPRRESLRALRRLALLPRTRAAIISGRALGDLAQLTASPERVLLVGSHGGEFDRSFADDLSPERLALRARIQHELSDIAGRCRGCHVEPKPAGAAFHFRNADAGAAEKALDEVLRGPGARDGVFIKHGKKVVELSVIAADKGATIDTLRADLHASAVLFLGDDTTDEDAFRRLRDADLGVKIGPGETAAHCRVASDLEAADLLRELADLRATWLARTGAATGPA